MAAILKYGRHWLKTHNKPCHYIQFGSGSFSVKNNMELDTKIHIISHLRAELQGIKYFMAAISKYGRHQLITKSIWLVTILNSIQVHSPFETIWDRHRNPYQNTSESRVMGNLIFLGVYLEIWPPLVEHRQYGLSLYQI